MTGSSIGEVEASQVSLEPCNASLCCTCTGGHIGWCARFLGELTHLDVGHGVDAHCGGNASGVELGDNSVLEVRFLASVIGVPLAGSTGVLVSLSSVGLASLLLGGVRTRVAIGVNDSLGHPSSAFDDGQLDNTGLDGAGDGTAGGGSCVGKEVANLTLVLALAHGVVVGEDGNEVSVGVRGPVGNLARERTGRGVLVAHGNDGVHVTTHLGTSVGDEGGSGWNPSGGVVTGFGVRRGGEVNHTLSVELDGQGHTLVSGGKEGSNGSVHRGELCATSGGTVIGRLGNGIICLWHQLMFLLLFICNLLSVPRFGSP